MAVLLNAVLVLMGVCVVQAARIALVPFPGSSHISQFGEIGKELLRKGHEVHLILPSSYPLLDKHRVGPFHLVSYHTVEPDIFSYKVGDYIKTAFGQTVMENMRQAFPGTEECCTNFLSSKKLYEHMKTLDINLFIMDAIPFTQCYYLLPYRLGKPFVTLVTTTAPFWYRNPSLPSFTPFAFGNPYTCEMTFWQRLDNLYSMLYMAWSPVPPYNTKDWTGMYAPEKPSVSLNDLLKKSSLWLMDTDVTIDYPRAFMPNEILIGGLTTQPAKALPPDFESIMDSAEQGAIIMSFGSLLPDINSERFMKVFTRLKQVVLWRHTSEYKGEVSDNVHLVKWLPQADLLGHNNTRLFITHCGANGQFEALYNGVPMVGFPAFAEQAYNAKRMVYHGFGREMHLFHFTEDELYEAIIDIIETPSYRENIQHASRIYCERPMRPLETASFWIEHVLKYGDRHLKSYALEMPWYSYSMLDIVVFIFMLCLVLLAFLLYICCTLKGKFLPSKQKRKTQ